MTKILLAYLILFAGYANAQSTKIVKLKATMGKIMLRDFTISKVVDDRSDTNNIGTMRAGLTNKTAFVTLPEGTSSAISKFINAATIQSPDNESIELHIFGLKVEEKAKAGRQQVDLTTQYAFFKNGKKIIDYSGSSYVQSGLDASAYIGKLVSQSIEQALKEFDTWWQSNKHLYDEAKMDLIEVKVVLSNNNSDPDQIIYNPSVPLTIADFAGTPDNLHKALAVTYSGAILQYEVSQQQTGNKATIEIAPYFDRTKSWMKPTGKTAYVLKHEQCHFDITAIKTFELINTLRNYKFTMKGFKDEVSMLQKQFSKEMEAMQAQYDGETSHGTLKEKQQIWEARIKAELKEKTIMNDR